MKNIIVDIYLVYDNTFLLNKSEQNQKHIVRYKYL